MSASNLILAFDTNTANLDPGLQRINTSLRQIEAQAQSTGKSLDGVMATVQTGAQGVGTALQTVSGALQSSGLVGAGSPLVVGLETIGAVTTRISTALSALGSLATGPVGILVAAVSGAVVVFQNWETITRALNTAFGASTVGMESARRATDAYTTAIDGITRATETAIEAQQRLARQAAETLRVATQSQIAAMQAQLETQHGIMERYRPDFEALEQNRRIGGEDPPESRPGVMRARMYEAASRAVEQIRQDILSVREQLANGLPQVLRGNQEYGPPASAPPRAARGGGGAAAADQELTAMWQTLQGVSRDQEAYDRAVQRTAESVRQIIDPTTKYREAIEAINEAQAAGVLTIEEAAAGVAHYQRLIESAGDTFDAAIAGGFGRVAKSTFGSLTSALDDIATGAKSASQAMAEFGIDFGRTVTNMIAQAAALQLIKSIFGAAGWTEMAASIGRRQAGGPVMAGAPYMVGEAGPELFVPSASGMIVPNSALGGGMQVVVNNNAPGVVATPTQVDERTISIAVDLARQQVAADYRDSMRFGQGPYSEPLARGFQVRRRV